MRHRRNDSYDNNKGGHCCLTRRSTADTNTITTTTTTNTHGELYPRLRHHLEFILAAAAIATHIRDRSTHKHVSQ